MVWPISALSVVSVEPPGVLSRSLMSAHQTVMLLVVSVTLADMAPARSFSLTTGAGAALLMVTATLFGTDVELMVKASAIAGKTLVTAAAAPSAMAQTVLVIRAPRLQTGA